MTPSTCRTYIKAEENKFVTLFLSYTFVNCSSAKIKVSIDDGCSTSFARGDITNKGLRA